MGLSGGQGQGWGYTFFFKTPEEEEERSVPSHRCSCKDIKLDPSRISEPAVMGRLQGEDTAPSFSSVLGVIKNIYKL